MSSHSDTTMDDDDDPDGIEPLKTTGTRAGPLNKHDYHVLADCADPIDLQYGVRYAAAINNIQDYGVFVSLTDPVDDADADISGLVHRDNIPNLYTPSDFQIGDEVGVMLYDHKENGDLAFEMVAVFDAQADAVTPLENDPLSAPPPHLAATFNEERDATRAARAQESAAAAAADTDSAPADAADDGDGDAADADDSGDAGASDTQTRTMAEQLFDSLDAIEEAIHATHRQQTSRTGDLERHLHALGETADDILAQTQAHAEHHAQAEAVTPAGSPAAAAADADDWPGRYPAAIHLLAQAAGDGCEIADLDYDAADGERTITITTRQ